MITTQQARVLFFILAYRSEHGYSPTIREVMTAMGFRSPNGVRGHLRALARNRLIQPMPRPAPARGIVPLVSMVPVRRYIGTVQVPTDRMLIFGPGICEEVTL
jgi:SOS-response transcriptional repressor LexA